MKRITVMTCMVILVAGCNTKDPGPSAESREYRYCRADDHCNLQWRMEQIERKIDAISLRVVGPREDYPEKYAPQHPTGAIPPKDFWKK